jgi:integrase/recombinase XerD
VKGPATFMSSIGPLIKRYLAMKRASGRRAVSMAYTFRYLDRFLVSSQAADLTQDAFLAWSQTMGSLCATTRAGRLRVVYNFCLFRRRECPDSFVPDPTQFPRTPPRPLPYIYSEADIIRLLTATEDLLPHKGSLLHGAVARIGIVILYTTGLRRGELVRLTLGDYDKSNRVLHVRRTKFDKSRLVPLSTDVSQTDKRERVLEEVPDSEFQAAIPKVRSMNLFWPSASVFPSHRICPLRIMFIAS